MDLDNAPESDLRPALKPPRFSLRSLLIAVAVLCAIFAAMKFVGPSGALLLVLWVLIVLAHVAGNAIGTALRASGDTSAKGVRGDPAAPARPPRGLARHEEFAPVTHLGERKSLGWGVFVLSAAGIIAGLVGGGLVMVMSGGPSVRAADVAFGGGAFGVLGGIWTFLGSSLFFSLFRAHSQAARNSRK